jgi:hypothetical protein
MSSTKKAWEKFISKTKSTSYEVLFVLSRVDKKDAISLMF